MNNVDEIKLAAKYLGACGMIDGVERIEDLIRLMFTPQGREFCAMNSFPDLSTIRATCTGMEKRGMFVDSGEITIFNKDNIVIAGDTKAKVVYDKSDKPYHIIVMHGAEVLVIAGRYTVVSVTEIGGKAKIRESKGACILMG